MSKETLNITSFAGAPLTLLGEPITVGSTAPDFTAIDADLKPLSLSDLKGKTVVISVFPSIDTPVCAKQTREFNRRATTLGENVVVIAISKDLPFALSRFCGAEGLDNVHPVSDYMYSGFGLKYGFLIKENQLLARGVVVIDPNGTVKYVQYVDDIVHEPNYDKALAAI